MSLQLRGSLDRRRQARMRSGHAEVSLTVRRAPIVLSRLGAAVLLLLVLTGADSPATTHVTITPTAAQTLRGWGMSLAWEANIVYGSPLLAARIQDPAEQKHYMDLLFADPKLGPGLGLNVARYNIGGGDNPDRRRCVRPPKDGLLPEAQIEGFLTEPNGGYDWSRDASQRQMLHEAQARGATLFEAFSNSAPWWMTVSGCVSGAERSGEDNLRADAAPAFTAYLARVVEHFRSEEGIAFASVSPVNEPDGTWWVLGNRQEGSFASLRLQEAVITALGRDLAGTATLVSGTEANNMDVMNGYLAQMDARSLAALGRVNVHQYNGSDPGALHRRVAALGKPLWASEVGCCFSNDRPEMWGALYMAASIQSALRELGAEVWCFWQTDWGVIDLKGGHPRPLKQFYTIAQFTRFIRPGFTVLSSRGENTLAAMSPDRRRLVLVAINRGDADEREDFDLGAFHRPGAAVAVYRTTADPSSNLAHEVAQVNAAGHLIDRQPPSSVTTYVIDGGPVAAGGHGDVRR
jgi:O-glycosyl hydrolase